MMRGVASARTLATKTMVCNTVVVPEGQGPIASVRRVEVQSGQIIFFLRFTQAGTGEVPYSVDIFDNGEINRQTSKSFDIGSEGEERTLVVTDLPQQGADVKVCIHPDSNAQCETVYVEGNKDFSGGGDDGDSGTGGPDIGQPNITNKQTTTNFVLVSYSLTNNGNEVGEKTINATLDVGMTTEVNGQKSDTITVEPQETAYESFEFNTDLTSDTNATVCIEGNCTEVTIPGSGDSGGNDDPDSGDIGPPTVENMQTITNEALITYSLTNTGGQDSTKEVMGTIDIGKTGEVDATKTESVQVGAGDTEYRSFEFLLDNVEQVEATVCVKET